MKKIDIILISLNPFTYKNQKQTVAKPPGLFKAVLTARISPIAAFSLIIFLVVCVALSVIMAQDTLQPGGVDGVAVIQHHSRVLGTSTTTPKNLKHK